jgi:hypothetical protein
MGTPSEIDFVNPYLSARRQWICTQLAILVPNPLMTIASNDAKTKSLFQEWTGHTQSGLEGHWKAEGFKKADDSVKEGGVWVRKGGGPVTTSCEGLIGQLFAKLQSAGLGYKPGMKPGRATSFNLPGCENGVEPATSLGWHWYRDRTSSVHPRAGDFFQAGTPATYGKDRKAAWSYAHVGVITGYVEGESPSWATVEAGQGGPRAGFDFMKRKDWRPVNPIDKNNPKKVLMGWLDIDEYFGD